MSMLATHWNKFYIYCMTGIESALDVDTLAPYGDQFGGSELMPGIMDLVDMYGDEINEYPKTGTYEELSAFFADINLTTLTLTVEVTRLVAMLASSEDVPTIISKLSDLYRHINKVYLRAVGKKVTCETCVDSCIDIDGVHQQMYDALSDPTTLGYNPEKVVSVFTDGIDSMNTHLFQHLCRE